MNMYIYICISYNEDPYIEINKKNMHTAVARCFFLGELPQDSEVYLITGTSLQHVLGWWSTIATDIY